MRTHAFHHAYQQRLSRSTKPFNARGAKVDRCKQCQIAKQYCVCAFQPEASDRVSALILLSENEILKPSNTGRLIADTIRDCHVFQWHRTEPKEKLLAILKDERYQPIVIFPEEYVEDKQRLFDSSTYQVNPNKRPLLIFLDGSWREARRMFRKSAYLNGFPVLSIQPDSVSQYLMRKSDNDNHLATAEVASLVLEQLNFNQESQSLSEWFGVFRESYLLTKTRNRPNIERPLMQAFVERKQR